MLYDVLYYFYRLVHMYKLFGPCQLEFIYLYAIFEFVLCPHTGMMGICLCCMLCTLLAYGAGRPKVIKNFVRSFVR